MNRSEVVPDDIESLIPPEDMDPAERLHVVIDILGYYTRKGIPLGDEVDQIFQAETAMMEGDNEKFEKHLRLALKNIVDDDDIEEKISWSRWLLTTLSLFEDVPQGIMDVFSEAEDLFVRGENEKASALLERLNRTAEDRLGERWKKLRAYTKGIYKAAKKNLDKETRKRVKRLLYDADNMMWIDDQIYRRKGLRAIREAHAILLERTTAHGARQ